MKKILLSLLIMFLSIVIWFLSLFLYPYIGDALIMLQTMLGFVAIIAVLYIKFKVRD